MSNVAQILRASPPKGVFTGPDGSAWEASRAPRGLLLYENKVAARVIAAAAGLQGPAPVVSDGHCATHVLGHLSQQETLTTV